MIPLTVIAGYLGAGKTHLINRMLASSAEPIGVCVNDFGELNIDAALIDNRSGATLELTNGCVCCQLTDDLGQALEELRSAQVTRVIVEASGVALPQKIAAYGRNWPGYRLHKTYTLVDASNIQRWLSDKYISAVASAQMQQADELLITKCDLVSPQATERWPWVQSVQSSWQLLPHGALSAAQVQALLAPQTPSPAAEVEPAMAPATHQPNLVASCHGAQAPIEPAKLRAFLAANPAVVRAKGWFVDADAQQYLLQHVGAQTCIEPELGGKPGGEPRAQAKQRSNGLVFLHHESQALDLGLLTTPAPDGHRH